MTAQPVIWSITCDRCGAEFCGQIYYESPTELRKDLASAGWTFTQTHSEKNEHRIIIEDLCKRCSH